MTFTKTVLLLYLYFLYLIALAKPLVTVKQNGCMKERLKENVANVNICEMLMNDLKVFFVLFFM